MGNNLPINAAYPDRIQIIDALYRLVIGIDDNDPPLLMSSLTSDCHVDYQKAGQIMGLSFPVLDDRDAAVETVLAVVGPLDTLHKVSTSRVWVNGDKGNMTAVVEAQHFPPNNRSRHLMMNSRYELEVRKDDGAWKISSLVCNLVWFDGDPQVLVDHLPN
jgi:SnoaL-like domain